MVPFVVAVLVRFGVVVSDGVGAMDNQLGMRVWHWAL
jgi:hypothetical protein